jgi:hypothetical protein
MVFKPTSSKNIATTNPWWAKIHLSIPLLLIFHFSFFIFHSCGLDIEDPTPPSPPVWVQKSFPEEWPERGIDAHESGGGIYLEWETLVESEIKKLHIYRAQYFDVEDSLGSYDSILQLEVEGITSSEWVDTQIETDVRYFYKLKSEDDANNLSSFSDPVSYRILRSVNSENSIPNGISSFLPSDRTLSWIYFFSIEMENYCVTVLSRGGEFILREIVLPGNYVGDTEQYTIPENILFEPSEIYKWRIDIGAKYLEGIETAGSESAWATFMYKGDSLNTP